MYPVSDFRVNYYFSRNGRFYVNLTRKGRNYDKPCKVMGDGTLYFKFLRKLWYESHKTFVLCGLHEGV